ncbi:MAG: hypothetical protein V1900_03910 [Candidatus Aenigmatarchaeota archaeon]
MADYSIAEASKMLGTKLTRGSKDFAEEFGIKIKDNRITDEQLKEIGVKLREYSTLEDIQGFVGYNIDYLRSLARRSRLGRLMDGRVYLTPSETSKFYDILEENGRKSAPDDVIRAAKEPERTDYYKGALDELFSYPELEPLKQAFDTMKSSEFDSNVRYILGKSPNWQERKLFAGFVNIVQEISGVDGLATKFYKALETVEKDQYRANYSVIIKSLSERPAASIADAITFILEKGLDVDKFLKKWDIKVTE